MKSPGNLFLKLAAALFALAGCASPATPTPWPAEQPTRLAQPAAAAASPTPKADPNLPVRGGVVSIGILQEPGALSPLLANNPIDSAISAFVVEGLVGIDADGNYAPALAENLPVVSNEGLTLTYSLKKNIRWADGTDFICADAQFTHEAILSSSNISGHRNIESVECPEDYTVVVTLEKVYAPYLSLFRYIIPRSAGDLANIGEWEYHKAPIGTGPWVVKEWKARDYIEFIPNPYYREEGQPYLDGIIVRILPGTEAGMQLLETEKITVLHGLNETEAAALEAMTGVRWVGSRYGFGENETLIFNLGPTDGSAPANPSSAPHPILGDLRTRQAIQYAIDKQFLADTLLPGTIKVGATVLPAGPFACPQPASEFSPDKAKALLEEAGWTTGADGIREKDGLRLSLKIGTTTGSPLREQTQQALIEMLRKVGIELVADNMPSDRLFASWNSDGARNKGRFDILMYTPGVSIDPDSHIFSNYHSLRIPREENEGAGNNFSRYINADVDQWIDEAASTTDLSQRRELYCKIAKQINQDLPRVFLYERLIVSGYRESLQNFHVSPGYADFTIDSQDWWLKK